NRRHPDCPLGHMDVPCAEGEDIDCNERPLALPPELVPRARIHSFRGRQGLTSSPIRFADFATVGMDRGTRRERLKARGDRYKRTLEHNFSTGLAAVGHRFQVTCHESSLEEGTVSWGHDVRLQLSALVLEDKRETTYTPEDTTHEFSCELRGGEAG